MKTITIFTPTYNRGYILKQLYDSLVRQTSKDFCWLIVDDGSTDETRAIIKKWIEQGDMDIRYYWQENGGKMRAHNYGAKLADTELFLCCDSDDYLTDNAVEKILERWNNYALSKDCISGIIGPKCVYKNNKKIENVVPLQDAAMTYGDFSFRLGRVKETFLVFVTEIIRRFPFPVQDGEKFIPEGYTYDQLDNQYQMIPLKEELMICHYLSDGYTMNNRYIELMKNNPKGFALAYNDYAKHLPWGKRKISSARNYVALSLYIGNGFFYTLHKSSTPILSILIFPLAYLRLQALKNCT